MLLYNLIKYLDRTSFNPFILTLSPEPEDSMKKRFEALTLPIYNLNNSRFIGLFLNSANVKRVISELKPDIIHTHGIRSDNIIKKLKFKNHVSTLHIYFPEDYRIKYGKLLGGFMSKNHLKNLDILPYTLACSEALANRISHELNINLDYVNNGVDSDLYCPVNSNEKTQLRKKLGFTADHKIFLIVSELNSGKNLDTVIKCLNSFQKMRRQFIVVGSGPEKASLENLAQSNKNIIFTGKLNNTHEYYKSADYFISASFSEGLSLSVLEAMSSGLPVILSDIPGHRSIFKNVSEYSYFFPAMDYNALNSCITKIENDKYDEISKQMRTIILDNYTAKCMSKNYQLIYDKICNSNLN